MKELFEIFDIRIDRGAMDRSDLNENRGVRRGLRGPVIELLYLIIDSRLFHHADRAIDGDLFLIVEQHLVKNNGSSDHLFEDELDGGDN